MTTRGLFGRGIEMVDAANLIAVPRELKMIDPASLIEVPKHEFPVNAPSPDEAYIDRENGVVVQVWNNATPGCDGTPWQGTIRVCVRHTTAHNLREYDDSRFSVPITWDDLQAIKDRFWPDQIAVEVFPPRSSIVNIADLRWIWVLPKGASLPFNLQASSINVLRS